MKRIRLFALLLCSIVILSGCVSDNEVKQEIARLKKESKDNPLDFTVHNTSMYDPNNGIINRKDKLFQDMILEHNIHEDGEIYYFAYFYNYGGNIKLFNGYRGDCFVLLGYIRTMRHIKDMHSLTITEIIEDEKYGSYALVDWNTGNKSIFDMYLMSRCKAIIMANSTFSYWGARLGKDNIVIYPQKWFQDIPAPDIFPLDWLGI